MVYVFQSEPPSPRSPHSPNGGTAISAAANGVTSLFELGILGPDSAAPTSGNFFEHLTASEFYKNATVLLLALVLIESLALFPVMITFICFLLIMHINLIIQVRDIAGSFRWAPFLALQTSNSFLTMLLLLSKYKMKSIPVVDLGDNKIENIITQSAVIHMLAECAGLHWFESWGTKKLSEVGLPMVTANQIIKVCGFSLLYE